jgi:hypothetical protein
MGRTSTVVVSGMKALSIRRHTPDLFEHPFGRWNRNICVSCRCSPNVAYQTFGTVKTRSEKYLGLLCRGCLASAETDEGYRAIERRVIFAEEALENSPYIEDGGLYHISLARVKHDY